MEVRNTKRIVEHIRIGLIDSFNFFCCMVLEGMVEECPHDDVEMWEDCSRGVCLLCGKEFGYFNS
jgi:hypothetical protein